MEQPKVLTAGGGGKPKKKRTKKKKSPPTKNNNANNNNNNNNANATKKQQHYEETTTAKPEETKDDDLIQLGGKKQDESSSSSAPVVVMSSDDTSSITRRKHENTTAFDEKTPEKTSKEPQQGSNDEQHHKDDDDHHAAVGPSSSQQQQQQQDDAQVVNLDDLYKSPPMKPLSDHNTMSFDAASSTPTDNKTLIFWLLLCFCGIMVSFVCYGLLLEYTTSGGRHLHELSFLFITSAMYTMTAAAGRYVRDEKPTTIPPARFAILGLTSMGSTFCSVRSLRYVIYPIQVLAKSCKPVPVMIMGALMGKKYPLRKYFNVILIVAGVALFMGGGDHVNAKKQDDGAAASQLFGIALLFISLCFDGGTGAYEDKLMSVHSVQPFDLMYNIQLGKTILAGVSLLVLNQVHVFLQMCQDMGFLLVALGLSGAMGQVFIFVTIAKFGALTCSIIGLARKVTTLVASIYFYGHSLNGIQFTGLFISITAMVLNFFGKKKGGGGHQHDDGHGTPPVSPAEMEKMLPYGDSVAACPDDFEEHVVEGDVELGPVKPEGIFRDSQRTSV